VLGTLNFLDHPKRVEGASLVRRGASFSLAQRFDADGPQKGWRRRTNRVHTMLDTGLDAERGQGFPHGLGGADDVVFMPLQASTQWDGLGHIFDHGTAWNGRRAGDVVTSEGDRVTGIETAAAPIAGRGVLLDVGRAIGSNGELPDGFAITTEHLEATIAAHGRSARVGRGDLVLVRTGRLARARREGWGDYAGGDSPGLSFTTADWLHGSEIAAIATDTWGFEVRPNEFDVQGEDAGTPEFLRAWAALTDQLVGQAEQAEKAGHPRTAGQLYARATNYLCQAERMLSNSDPNRIPTYRRVPELAARGISCRRSWPTSTPFPPTRGPPSTSDSTTSLTSARSSPTGSPTPSPSSTSRAPDPGRRTLEPWTDTRGSRCRATEAGSLLARTGPRANRRPGWRFDYSAQSKSSSTGAVFAPSTLFACSGSSR
jgi:hypothetical protein